MVEVKTSPRARDLLPLGIFVAVALFFTWKGFLPGRILVPVDLVKDLGAWKPDPLERRPVSNQLLSDVVLQFMPWDREARRLLHQGEVPWINAYSGDGAPLFANPQAALLSPFTWPRLVFGERGWAICVFLKLFISGLGLFWLARELGMEKRAAIFSAAVFQACGFSILWALHPLTNVFPLLPILAAALIRLIRIPSAMHVAAVVASSAAATAGGHPETLMQGVATIALLLLILFLLKDPSLGPRPSAKAWLRGTAAAVTGFLFLSIQLVPFFWLLSRGHILDIRHDRNLSGFRFSAMFGEILPGVLGSPLKGEIDLSAFLRDKENFVARNEAFIGVITLVLIAIAWRRFDRWVRGGLTVGLVALAAAWSLPILRSFIHVLPGVSLAAPERWDIVFVVIAALAAGPALVIVSRDDSHRIPGTILLAAGLLVATAGLVPSLPAANPILERIARQGIAVLRVRAELKEPDDVYVARLAGYLARGRLTALRRLAMPGACWAVAGWALLQSRKRLKWIAAAALAELAFFSAGFLPAIRRSELPPAPLAIGDIQRLDPTRKHLIIAGEEVLPPNLSTLNEVRDFRTFDLLESRDQIRRRWICGYNEAAHAFPAKVIPGDLPCLAAAGVAFAMSREPITGTRLVGGGPPPAVGVYEIPFPAGVPMPENLPPRGLVPGAAVSIAALAATIALCAEAHQASRAG